MKKARPTNNIRKLRKERGWSGEYLGKIMKTTKVTVSRLENGDTPLDADWMMKLSTAFGVHPSEVSDAPLSKNFIATTDPLLVGDILGWLLEANDKYGAKLTNKELPKLATFLYRRAAQHSYNSNYIHNLTFTVVEAIREIR